MFFSHYTTALFLPNDFPMCFDGTALENTFLNDADSNDDAITPGT